VVRRKAQPQIAQCCAAWRSRERHLAAPQGAAADGPELRREAQA